MLRHLTNLDEPVCGRILATVAADRIRGHYARRRCPNWVDNWGFKKNFGSIVRDGKRLDARLRAAAFVFSDGSEDRGFLVASETPFAFARNLRVIDELWMVSVFPEFRARGFGRKMVNEFLDSFRGELLLARCLPASRAAKNMLVKMGFRPLPTPGSEITYLAFGSGDLVAKLAKQWGSAQ